MTDLGRLGINKYTPDARPSGKHFGWQYDNGKRIRHILGETHEPRIGLSVCINNLGILLSWQRWKDGLARDSKGRPITDEYYRAVLEHHPEEKQRIRKIGEELYGPR